MNTLQMISILYAQVPDPTGVTALMDYLNLGVIVVGTMGLIRGWIVPKYVVDALQQDRNALKKEYDELRNRLDTEVFPQLWKTTNILAQFAEKTKEENGER